MKGSTKTAMAVGAGYVLGRRRNLRLAAVVAAAAGVGSTPVAGKLLKRGGKLLGAAGLVPELPPELSEIVGTVRADLLPAGKAALSTAATSRVDALTDALHERAELIRDPEAAVSDIAAGTAGEAKRTTGAAKRTGGKVASTAKGSVLDEDEDQDEDDNDRDEQDRDEQDTRDEQDRDERDARDDKPAPRVRRGGTATRAKRTVTRARR